MKKRCYALEPHSHSPLDSAAKNAERSTPALSRRKLLSALGAAGLAIATGGELLAAPKQADAQAPASTALYNVKDFGASGSQRYDVDDTLAIQSAIDTAAAYGGIVYIPAGMYFLRSPLRLRANVTLLGAGSSSILRAAMNKFALITVTAAQHVTISKLALQGMGSFNNNSMPRQECGVALEQAVDVQITDCVFSQIDNGVVSSLSDQVYVNNCTFDSLIGTLDIDTQGFGIWCSEASRHQLESNRFNMLFQPCITLSKGSTRSLIANNNMTECYQSGILLTAKPDEKPCELNTISGNLIEKFKNPSNKTGYTYGIRLQGYCTDNQIQSNRIYNIEDVGISLEGQAANQKERPHHNHISNNVLRAAGRTGISLVNSYANQLRHNSIHESTADGIALATSGKDAGSYCDRNQVAHNSLNDSVKAPIRIVDSRCGDNIVLGNYGERNGDKIIDKGTDTVTSYL